MRWRAKEMGLPSLADHKDAPNTVTAVKPPESIDSKALLKTLRVEDGVVFGGGQQQLEGRSFALAISVSSRK